MNKIKEYYKNYNILREDMVKIGIGNLSLKGGLIGNIFSISENIEVYNEYQKRYIGKIWKAEILDKNDTIIKVIEKKKFLGLF